MKIIDLIWEELTKISLNEVEDITDIALTREGLEILKSELREIEMYDVGTTEDDLAEAIKMHFGLNVLIKIDGEKTFKLLRNLQ